MKLDTKFSLFKSGGITKEERRLLTLKESAKNKFKEEAGLVKQTVKTKGFQIIVDLLVADIEYEKERLTRCKDAEFKNIQNRILAKKNFLDMFTPYME